MDGLSEFLSIARVEGSLFSRAELRAPWGVATSGGGAGIFHAVVAGAGFLEVEGEPVRAFRAGDLLVMPHGHAHVLRDGPASPVRHISAWPSRPGPDGLPCLDGGGGGAPTSLLCGTFRLDEEGRDALLPLLPPVIHVQGATGWLDSTLRLMADELRDQRPGSAVLVARLADLLFVHVLRAWLEQSAGRGSGWLGALTDSRLGRAIGLIHGEPARPWTVAGLAREAGMSRSAFFSRFSNAVGEAPAAYLTRWRMTLARILMRRTTDGLGEIAEQVGYRSQTAFHKAFKRTVGANPGAWRRAAAPA